MLSQDEEQKIRETVRRSLDSILHETADEGQKSPIRAATEVDRVTDAKRIIAEETESYYTRMGLVKHASRSGQVFWVTPDERERLRERRRRTERGSRFATLVKNPKVTFVWAITILFAVLLVSYLVHTDTVGNFMIK